MITIKAEDIPELRVPDSTATIKDLTDGTLELLPCESIGIQVAGDQQSRLTRVYDVDWELADKLIVISDDGDVFLAHIRDWDEDHGVVVIEID